MKHTLVTFVSVLALASLSMAGCEKVNHKNIEKWERTEKGAGKLKAALTGDHSVKLRAHAAQILIRRGELDTVTATLEKARDAEAIMAELESRLWKDAAVDGPEMKRPSGTQVAAKDALFDLRKFASDETKTQLDAHLVEWLTGGFYEGRARTGRHSGRRIVRAIGPGAGPAIIAAAQSVLAKPPQPGGGITRVGDEVLAGLAYSGHPKALSLLLDLIENEQKEPTLPKRSMNAIYAAYVKPGAGIEPAPGRYLKPVVERLAAIGRDENSSGRMANDAFELLAKAGMPECLPPFVSFVSYAHSKEAFRYVGIQRGIPCGGVAAIVPITKAIPTTVAYERAVLNKYLWREILALPEQKAVADKARSLLEADSWVARVTAVEILGALSRKSTAKADAELISKLSKDRTKLRGWWGKDSKKADPTLGQVASEVAKKLGGLAQVERK